MTPNQDGPTGDVGQPRLKIISESNRQDPGQVDGVDMEIEGQLLGVMVEDPKPKAQADCLVSRHR